MQKAAKSFETLHGAADSTAASLHNANSAFLNSVRSLDKSLAPMRKKIGQLRDILEAQKKSQDAFLNHVGNSVSRLEGSTQAATMAFSRLAELESSWNEKLDRQNLLLDEHLSGLSSSVDVIPAALGREIRELWALLRPLPEHIKANGQTLAQTLRDNGQEQRQLLGALEGLVSHAQGGCGSGHGKPCSYKMHFQ